MERTGINYEYMPEKETETIKIVKDLNKNKKILNKEITKEFEQIKNAYADKRKTRIEGAIEGFEEEDLIRILKEPKNALTKQYERLFEFENIRLRFTEGSLAAIAKKALKRKSGARGLRSVMEEAMLDVMYDLPSKENVQECVISEQVIDDGDYPVILYANPEDKRLESA